MKMKSGTHGMTRRTFIQSALVGGSFLAFPIAGRGENEPRNLTALVLERKNAPGLWSAAAGHLGELIGARHALTRAGFVTSDLDLARPLQEQPADVLVLGSFVSCHDDIVQYLETNRRALRDFCAQGGIVVQMVEAPVYTEGFNASSRPLKETSPFFLPQNSLSAKRTRETFWDLYVRRPDHPLLAGMDLVERDGQLEWNLSEKFGHTASWMPIGDREGFQVLVSHTGDDSRAALVEAPFVNGRYILCSLFLDKLVRESGQAGQSAAFTAEAERFFTNLYSYTEQVRAGNAPPILSAVPYADPPPTEFPEGSFTIVLIPDTQYYCQTPAFNQHFHNLVDWIVARREALNIKYVLHEGDLVNQGGLQMHQWDIASAAMHKLDGKVPYAIALGNHDYTDNTSRNRATPLNDFFPPSAYEPWPTFGGVMEPGHLENSWHTFHAGGMDFLILCLEFGPRDHVLAWANSIVERHPNHRAILNTHAYTYSDSRRYNKIDRAGWQIWNPLDYNSEGGGNDGEQMWEKLVDRHRNFFLVINGHVINDGLGRAVTRTRHGNAVQQMLFNYQGYFQGGMGTVRLLHFLPDQDTVKVTTFSASEGRYSTGPQEQFSFQLGALPLPLTMAPANFAFGSAEGRAGGELFFFNAEREWALRDRSLRVAPTEESAGNSLAVTQIDGFAPGAPFFIRARFALAGFDSLDAGHRLGLVLFGKKEPGEFDVRDDGTFHSFQWIPASASGGSIALREGMDGPIVQEISFDGLANPPVAPLSADLEATDGAGYTLEFYGAYSAEGNLEFVATLEDGAGGKATLSGTMLHPPSGNHFGFGVRHSGANGPSWDFLHYDWLNVHPVPMPFHYAFGTGPGKEGDEAFFKTGGRGPDWSLEETSLRLSRPFGSAAGDEAAGAIASVPNHSEGQDFALRSTFTAALPAQQPGFLRFDGANDSVRVPGDNALKPLQDSYTWEFWARLDSSASGWNLPIEYPGGDRYYVGYNANSGWNFVVTSNGSRTDSNADRWVARITGRWVFVQAVLDRENQKQTLRVYDALEDAWHQAEVTPGAGTTVPTGDLFIPSPPNLWPYQGDLREVRFWRRARTRAEAENDRFAPLNGDEPGLAAYWRMDEEGPTVPDLSGNGNHGILEGQPQWKQPDAAAELCAIGLTALGQRVRNGSLPDVFDSSFSFQWLPAANAEGGELVLALPLSAGGGRTGGVAARLDLSGAPNPPTLEQDRRYILELAGFYDELGDLRLVGKLLDDTGRAAEIVQRIVRPAAFHPGDWFGMAGRLPEGAPPLNWEGLQMGTPGQLGIDPPGAPETTYHDWLSWHFTEAERNDPVLSGRDAAPAGDRVTNLIKYGFGMNPWTPVSGADLPQAELVNGRLRLSYPERREPRDIDYTPRLSENLSDWTGDAVIETERVPHPEWAGFDRVTVEAEPPPGATRGFMRIEVRERQL